MSKVLIVNPPSHRRGRRLRVRKNPMTTVFYPSRKTRLFRRAKSGRWGEINGHGSKSRRRHSIVLRRVRKHAAKRGILHRHIRRSRPKVQHSNPFGGELAIIGNPPKKRRHTMARHKKHRRRHRALIHNPFSASALMSKPKELLSGEFFMEAVAGTAGFVLPNVVLNYAPIAFRDTKVKFYAAKLVTIGLLSVVGNGHSKKTGRIVMLGGVISLLLDAWTEWKARSAGAPPKTGTSAYYGGMEAYYGPGIEDMGDAIEGVDAVGDSLVLEGVGESGY